MRLTSFTLAADTFNGRAVSFTPLPSFKAAVSDQCCMALSSDGPGASQPP